MRKTEPGEILSKSGHIFPSDRGYGKMLKPEESLYNDATVKTWKDAVNKGKDSEEYYDPLEGNHIGINSEFFE